VQPAVLTNFHFLILPTRVKTTSAKSKLKAGRKQKANRTNPSHGHSHCFVSPNRAGVFRTLVDRHRPGCERDLWRLGRSVGHERRIPYGAQGELQQRKELPVV
jgi:hypothetical protein